jgi:N-acetylglucosamine kinase-like BadF-type ATPase
MSKVIENHAPYGPASKSGLSRAALASGHLFLGIDGGGSKTHAVVTDSSLTVIGEGFSGGSNPLRVGLEEAVVHIEEAVNEACTAAGLTLRNITSACAAIAGVNHAIHFHTMKDALDRALGLEDIELVTDAQAALQGALGGRPGVAIIAGTGSIALGMNESGEQARSGGWGPTLADEGSGYDIARRALRAVISSFDERSPKTLLAGKICRRLGIDSPEDLPGVIYNSDSEPVEIAGLAELVDEAALEGDRVAACILADAGRELGKLAVSVIEKLDLQEKSFRVACVGSVFKSGEHVLGPLRDAVLAAARRAEIGPPLFTPAIGAAKLAQKRCQMTEAGC